MPNHRISKKQMQKNYIRQFNEMKCCIKHQEEMMNGLFEQMDRQKEILNLYYKEYQEMKRRQEKQYLMTYIRMLGIHAEGYGSLRAAAADPYTGVSTAVHVCQ